MLLLKACRENPVMTCNQENCDNGILPLKINPWTQLLPVEGGSRSLASQTHGSRSRTIPVGSLTKVSGDGAVWVRTWICTNEIHTTFS